MCRGIESGCHFDDERFFRGITTERMRRGVFTSVPELIGAIDEYIAHHNTKPKPFIWTKSARDILQKVIRANSRLSSKQNATLHQVDRVAGGGVLNFDAVVPASDVLTPVCRAVRITVGQVSGHSPGVDAAGFECLAEFL